MVLDVNVDVGLGDGGCELRRDHCFRGDASASMHHRRHLLLLFCPASAASALDSNSGPNGRALPSMPVPSEQSTCPRRERDQQLPLPHRFCLTDANAIIPSVPGVYTASPASH